MATEMISPAKHDEHDQCTSRELEAHHKSTNYPTEIYGFEADENTLPKGYFRSPFFLGTMLATGLGVVSGNGAFALAAPNLAIINAEIGPDANIIWVSLSYTLTLAVSLIMVGRLSDLFGRRVSIIRQYSNYILKF
jgi:hypothetical protein